MTTQQKAVIIGLWRMGAVIEQMCFVLKTPAYKIEKVIEDYKKLLHEETRADNPTLQSS